MSKRDINSYEADYDSLPFEAEQAAMRRVAILAEVNKYKPSRVLEVGCGDHPLFTQYTDYEHMVVVEPGQRFAGQAEQMAAALKRPKRIDVHQAFLEQVDFGSQQFDMVVLASLLHEVDEPKTLLKKALSVSHKNTLFLVNVPNETSFHRCLAKNIGLIETTDELSAQQRHLQQGRIFNTKTLAQLLDDCGLSTIESSTIIFKPFTHAQMQALIDHGILSKAQIHGLCGMNDMLQPHLGSEIISLAKLKTV